MLCRIYLLRLKKRQKKFVMLILFVISEKTFFMKKLTLTCALAFIGLFAMAQVSFDAKTNHEKEKTFGPPVEKMVIDSKSGDSVLLSVEVMLKKPIILGCQYIYRITNKSKDKKVKVTSEKYADQFQMKGEKIKPGESVDFLVNTMSRCEGSSGYEKCIDCQPPLTITKIEIK